MEEKKYGGLASFFGIVFLLCGGLTVYYIKFIPVLTENHQTYGGISVKPSAFEKLLYQYLSFYDTIFGKTPATPALAVIIPISLVVFIVFCYYLYKFVKQKQTENNHKRQEQAEKKLLELQTLMDLKASVAITEEEKTSEGEENNDQSTI